MAVTEEYKRLARDEVDVLNVLRYIENDLNLNFNINEGTTINLRCPYEVYDIDSSVHESSSITKTSLSLKTNRVKCYNPACPCNKTMDNIAIVGLFYDDLSFEEKVKTVLEIGGFEYESEERELSPETRQAILRTNYVLEKNEQLLTGYEIIESEKEPVGRYEALYVDAAKYLLGRGITKNIARKMKFGIGGGPSKIIKNTSTKDLIAAKIINAEYNFEIMSKRILIPNILSGLVVGITGRSVYESDRRYLNVGNVRNLINIDRAKKHDTIFMFEGALNGASYEIITGEENFITLQGASTFKKEFLSKIALESAKFSDNTEFVYIADNDTAGLYAAKELGLDVLRLGFTLNVVVFPKKKDGSKIDLNDILKEYGKEKALDIWNKLTKKAEPFIIFAIKQEFTKLKGLNKLTLEIRKTKIIEKYLKMDFVDPYQRWILEQYFISHGYPVTNEFFKYVDLKFSKKPVLASNKLICFVGEIDPVLEQNLIETEKEYNVIDVSTKQSIYDLDPSIEIILITNSLYLFKTKKLYEVLTKAGHLVRIHYSDKPIKSLIEYVYATTKAIEGRQLFDELKKIASNSK